VRKGIRNVDEQKRLHLQSACVKTFEEVSDGREINAKDDRVVRSFVACEQLLVAAVTVSVRRENGSVNNVDKEKQESVHLPKNSSQRGMKAFLEKVKEPTLTSSGCSRPVVVRMSVMHCVARVLRRWWLQASHQE
jgi:diaminopimelate epimerase